MADQDARLHVLEKIGLPGRLDGPSYLLQPCIGSAAEHVTKLVIEAQRVVRTGKRLYALQRMVRWNAAVCDSPPGTFGLPSIVVA